MLIYLISLVFIFSALEGCNLSKQNATTGTDTDGNISNITTVNSVGNTFGNIINTGYVAQQGEWIYYSNQGLYKMKLDGTEKTKLFDDLSPEFVYVANDWIYFTNGIYQLNLYKIRTDGTRRNLISNDPVGYFNVVGEWIYYSKGAGKDFGIPGFGNLYKMKTDGTEKTKISDVNLGYIIVSGDWIYYFDSETTDNYGGITDLYRIKTDGTEKTKLLDKRITSINIMGDWIYYCNKGIFKAKSDASNKSVINNGPASGYINIAGNWIFYKVYNLDDSYKIFKIKTDGTGKTEVK